MGACRKPALVAFFCLFAKGEGDSEGVVGGVLDLK